MSDCQIQGLGLFTRTSDVGPQGTSPRRDDLHSRDEISKTIYQHKINYNLGADLLILEVKPDFGRCTIDNL